jgi:hypothetical protein
VTGGRGEKLTWHHQPDQARFWRDHQTRLIKIGGITERSEVQVANVALPSEARSKLVANVASPSEARSAVYPGARGYPCKDLGFPLIYFITTYI